VREEAGIVRVVVIGGGVVGLACGYELCRRGADVTVIDQGDFGAAASWGNAGWVTPSFSSPLPAPGLVRSSLGMMLRPTSPLYVKPRVNPGFSSWLWKFSRHCNDAAYGEGLRALANLNRGTLALFDELAAGAHPFEMHRDGILFVFSSTKGMHHVLDDLNAMHELGYARPEILSAEDTRALEPTLSGELVGGVLASDERHVYPPSLSAALVDGLRAAGATLLADTEVQAIRVADETVGQVDTTTGSVTGDVFVLAAGAWSGRLAETAGFRLPMEAGKGYSISISAPALKLKRPLYLTEARVGVSPFGNTLRVAGTMELSGINDVLDRRRINAIRRDVTAYLPAGWEDGERVTEWVGMRPILPDGLPAIGRAPGVSNLFLGTGHGMLGVTLAPVTAAALGDLICEGRTEVDLTAFDPGRFDA
jgi:D-amino-acid dehydrogenase